jgi:hypothetical protein
MLKQKSDISTSLYFPLMKSYTAYMFVALTLFGPGTAWTIGPLMISGLMIVRSKVDFWSEMKDQAASSASFLEALQASRELGL